MAEGRGLRRRADFRACPGVDPGAELRSEKKRFSGRGRPRFSRSVLPSYSRRKMPRRCNSGTTRSTKSSRPAGRKGNMMLKPSQASAEQPLLHLVGDHRRRAQQRGAAVAAEALGKLAHRQVVRFARSMARSRPLLLALVSGIWATAHPDRTSMRRCPARSTARRWRCRSAPGCPASPASRAPRPANRRSRRRRRAGSSDGRDRGRASPCGP